MCCGDFGRCTVTKYTVEYEGGGHQEIEARSLRDASRVARRTPYHGPGYGILEIRPFAAKPRETKVSSAPTLTVKPDPFEKLKALLS
jgi:hypothetical protein